MTKSAQSGFRRWWALWLPYLRVMLEEPKWLSIGLLSALVTLAAGLALMGLAGGGVMLVASTTLLALRLGLFGSGVLRIVSRYMERVSTHEATFRLIAWWRGRFYDAVEPLSPHVLMQHRQSDLLSRLVNDVEALDNLYIRIVLPTLVLLVLLLIMVFLFEWILPGLGWSVLAVLLVVSIALPLWLYRRAEQLNRQLLPLLAQQKQQWMDVFQGFDELRSFGQMPNQWQAIHHSTQQWLQLKQRLANQQQWANVLVSLGLFVILLVVLWQFSWALSTGTSSHLLMWLIPVILMLVVLNEVFAPLPGAWLNLGHTQQAVERLNEFVDHQQCVANVNYGESKWVVPDDGDSEAPSLRLDRLGFRYPSTDEWVFNALSLTLNAGDKIAIMGASGEGKSTLLKLLVRFLEPTHGDILWCGQHLAQFSESALRRLMTVVSQESHLLSASVRDNLALAAPHADEAAMWHVLSVVELTDTIQALADGLDTKIDFAAQNFSGGQIRRLILAQSLLKPAPLLIWDEPTEGLDAVTEAKVLHNLRREMGDRLLILITHREACLTLVDRVYQLSQGQLIQQPEFKQEKP